MDPILKSLGYTQGSVGERMSALAKDHDIPFPEADAGREQLIPYL